MKRIDKLAEDYAEVWPDDYGTAVLSYQAGYLDALRHAAVRGRIAQLQDQVVDSEILALAGEEE